MNLLDAAVGLPPNPADFLPHAALLGAVIWLGGVVTALLKGKGFLGGEKKENGEPVWAARFNERITARIDALAKAEDDEHKENLRRYDRLHELINDALDKQNEINTHVRIAIGLRGERELP